MLLKQDLVAGVMMLTNPPFASTATARDIQLRTVLRSLATRSGGETGRGHEQRKERIALVLTEMEMAAGLVHLRMRLRSERNIQHKRTMSSQTKIEME